MKFKAVGIEMNDDVAASFDLSKEWENWDGEQYESTFCDIFENKHGIRPTWIMEFHSSRGAEISGLRGFNDCATYLLFQSDEERDLLDSLSEILDENDIEIERGSWSQLV